MALFNACNFDSEAVESPLKLTQVPQSKAPGVIPPGVGLNEIVNLPEQHTWRDLDAYYREQLPAFYGTDYYNNLRELVLFHMVNPFHFEKEAGKEVLEYYFNEMQQVDLMNPDAFLAVAASLFLNGWTKEQVRAAAADRFEKNRKVFSTFDDPETALKKYAEKHERLKRFAANFPNRWGGY